MIKYWAVSGSKSSYFRGSLTLQDQAFFCNLTHISRKKTPIEPSQKI